MDPKFSPLSTGLISSLVVAGLALIANLVPQEKMLFYLFGIAIFVATAGLVAFALNVSSVSYAERALEQLTEECAATLRHVRTEYTSSILRGAIIHDFELDALERSIETEEVWVMTPLNLDHDVPGREFFNSLKENLDIHHKNYMYIIRDSEQARFNARAIAEQIDRTDLLKFALLSENEWNSLPIVGIPVTIHNPRSMSKLRIYISTQQSKDRGQHWAVFSGWTTGQIIERTRVIVSSAKCVRTLAEYAAC